MKKWPLIVAGLYGVALFTLGVPLFLIAFYPAILRSSEVQEALVSFWLWTPIAIMVLAQVALLRVPVYVAARRPVTKRPLLITIGAAAFMMGLLVFGAAGCVYEFIFKDQGEVNPFLLAGSLGISSWIFWAIYFYRSTKHISPAQTISQLQRFMWSGSILEFLVAIPTHIIARNRDYCCAGVFTFIGLTCGLSVMLFAFGPAVYFLFAERWRRLHPSQAVAGRSRSPDSLD